MLYSSEGRRFYLPSCLVLSYLRTPPVCCWSLNTVRHGFLKNVFMYKILPPVHFYLYRLTDFNSVETEIGMRKLLYLGCLVTEPKMAPSVRNLLISRTWVLLQRFTIGHSLHPPWPVETLASLPL